MIDRRWFRVGYPALVFFILLAGDAWRYTVGWYGWAVVVLALAAVAVALLVRNRLDWRVGGLPYPLLVFLAYAALSTAWSFYPGATALGLAGLLVTAVGAVGVAVSFTWAELLRSLGVALRAILGLSFLFELYVALIVRTPILPVVPEPGIDYSTLGTVPPMLYWSRDQLFQVFSGGKIQGIVGNSVLLSFVALLGIIVFALQFAGRTAKRRWTLPWLALAVLALAFSRSATVIVALVVVVIVAFAVLAVRRAPTPRARLTTHVVIGAIAVLGAAAAVVARNQLFALLGKSDDLTGRVDIWAAVIHLAQQRPAFGWGWVSQWIPWVAPFNNLAFNNGVRQLHAHDAWIDIWFQLGIVGLVIFGALVLSTTARSWLFAVDRPQAAPGEHRPYRVDALLPLLVMTALLVQSITESKLLVEFGMLFLIIAAVKTKGERNERYRSQL
jgi:O-antigen ligase